MYGDGPVQSLADLTLILLLYASAIITGIALIVILRSWWKSRLLPTILYLIAIACFAGMALDLLLDQVWEPFTDWGIVVDEGVTLWWSNILLSFFVVGGFLFWYYAIMYSQHESPPRSSALVTFIAGGALFGELVKAGWSALLPLIIEAIAFGILIIEILRYARVVLRVQDTPEKRRPIFLYFLGFLLWISAGPVGIILGGIPGIPEWIGNSWSVPYSIGLLLVAYTVAMNPRLLFISVAVPHDLLILDKDGTLLFGHRFYEYPGSVDSELMGSAMSGVMTLLKEMLASGQQLQRVDHGDVKILFEEGIKTTFLLIVSKETSRFRQSLRNAVMEFEANYRETLLSDTGNVTAFQAFRHRAQEIFL
jgi:hypothetical protein